ncbi:MULTISPECIES: hypothetical protein [unclassified Pseudofrankia]|uniref:hypothetical protein n=1 Tax=unclassified Pseudofrankia TaxID=2994372 RepID=UPI0012FF80D6|nr:MULTISPECIES: hypothetical protein [unclassified Pseudofrankia]MDT3440141.1 hypothetical protein [Pseudofrankia sp. BMG5.37]
MWAVLGDVDFGENLEAEEAVGLDPFVVLLTDIRSELKIVVAAAEGAPGTS